MVQTAIKTNVTLDSIHQLLTEGHAQEALSLVNRHNEKSDPWQNARGVCLLRLGQFEQAIKVFQRIVFPGESPCVPQDMPALYRANFATAMLLADRADGAIAIIEHLEDDGHPYVRAVRQAAQRWKQGLSLMQKLGLWVGWYPKRHIVLDFPPGDV